MQTHKFGKLAPRRLMATPAFGDFLDHAKMWPSVKPWGWENAVPPAMLSILGNDLYGCCAPAGAGHLAQVQTANTGEDMHPTTEQCLALYSTLTGFRKDDPDSDQGTVLIDLLKYWKTTGIPMTDKDGKEVLHKIRGWASLDLASVAQMRYANYLFGGTYLGINCPRSAEENTDNWTYVPKSPSVGGHCIIGAGQGAAGGKAGSWGMWIPHTWEFMLHQLDEGYVVMTDHWLNSQGVSPSGLNLNGLVAAMAAL